jgi:hypothetical protein
VLNSKKRVDKLSFQISRFSLIHSYFCIPESLRTPIPGRVFGGREVSRVYPPIAPSSQSAKSMYIESSNAMYSFNSTRYHKTMGDTSWILFKIHACVLHRDAVALEFYLEESDETIVIKTSVIVVLHHITRAFKPTIDGLKL